MGANSFADVSGRYGLIDNAYANQRPYPHAHNLVLAILTEYGILGLAIFAWIAVRLMRTLTLAGRSLTSEARRLTVGIQASFVGFVVAGMVDYTLHQNVVAAAVFMLLACAVIVRRRRTTWHPAPLRRRRRPNPLDPPSSAPVGRKDHPHRTPVRMTRAGLPAASAAGGMSLVTRLPAATIAPAPIVTPLRTITRAPIQTPSPIDTRSIFFSPSIE